MGQSGFQKINPDDLKDPSLFRLNQMLEFVHEQIYAVQGGSPEGYSFFGPMTFPQAFLTNEDVPTDAKALLTRAAGDKLYGPQALKNQITTGRFEGTPIGGLGTGSSGGGGGVPGPPGPAGGISPWVNDTYAATWTADILLGWNHQMTLTGNVAVAVPTGGTSGQPVLIRAIKDATGGREIALDSGWKNARPDPGYQEALTSCIISGVFLDATTVFVLNITENIPA